MLPSESMSRALLMAGFGVTLYGRIWVIPEGAVLGFFLGFIGVAVLLALLATRYGMDVFHWYIIQPTAPPGGYRTPLDVPPATWPNFLMLGVGLLLGKVGAGLGKKAEQRLRRNKDGGASTYKPRSNDRPQLRQEAAFFEAQCPKCGSIIAVFHKDPNRLNCYKCDTPLLVEISGGGGILKEETST